MNESPRYRKRENRPTSLDQRRGAARRVSHPAKLVLRPRAMRQCRVAIALVLAERTFPRTMSWLAPDSDLPFKRGVEQRRLKRGE
jgi:hypothetical protein